MLFVLLKSIYETNLKRKDKLAFLIHDFDAKHLESKAKPQHENAEAERKKRENGE